MRTIGTVKDDLVTFDWMKDRPIRVFSERAGIELLTLVACAMAGLPDRAHQLPAELADIMACKLSDEWLMMIAPDLQNGGRMVGICTWETFRKTAPDVVDMLHQIFDLTEASSLDKH